MGDCDDGARREGKEAGRWFWDIIALLTPM
jgi:hypothetical protein